MSTRAPFTVAIIQDGVESTASATFVATEQRIRDAAGKGAQVICLKELFNAPYFCKRLDASRFDLAEEVTGATVTRLQVVAKELAIVSSCRSTSGRGRACIATAPA
jgi:N-carbamoylputrescine amidase